MEHTLEQQILLRGGDDELSKTRPAWLIRALDRARQDPFLTALNGDEPVESILKKLNLVESKFAEQLFTKVFESATTVRALATEIKLLQGQAQSLTGDALAAQAALNVAVRGRDEAELEREARQRFIGVAYSFDVNEYQALENWATNAFAPSPPFDFYSEAKVTAVGVAQSAVTGRTSNKPDDGDLASWVRQVSARQEFRQQCELIAAGNLWRVGRKLNKDAMQKASDDHERLRRQTLKLDADSGPDEAKNAASWNYDIGLRTDEVAARLRALGVSGHDFDSRLTNAAVRFVTERRCLQIYIAALISSIKSIPAYRDAYSPSELENLAAMSETFAEMGDGADLVFESLTRLDLMNKRIALNTNKAEFAVVLKFDKAKGYFTGTLPSGDGTDSALFRYARLALLDEGLITNSTLEGPNGSVANSGSVLPMFLVNKGEAGCVQTFWNTGISGKWRLRCDETPTKATQAGILLTIGYEQIKFR
jgi:hypothetical protein